MNGFWNQRSDRSQDTPAGGEDQLSMIPTWSVVLAVIVFGAVQYLFHGVLPHHKHELLPMRLLMGYSWGTAFASYVLLVGYVSRDVRRRRMPAGLWMLIVVVMPGGIGAVVYFLLRQPMMIPCPHCSTETYLERALLSAVSVPTGSGLWTVLPRRPDYGCVLHAVRT